MERKLAFDPTPIGLVGERSLRKRYKNEWARIRNRRFAQTSLDCDICGKTRPTRAMLDAHEVYSYSTPQIVRLERIVFICKHCHEAIHLERTRHRSGKKWIAEVEAHYCTVNGITQEILQTDYHQMLARSRELSKLYGGLAAKPALDYGAYQAAADLCDKRRRIKKVDEDDDAADFEMYPDHECPDDLGHAE
jgi:hypothetical protein